jgi:hypothetical protein
MGELNSGVYFVQAGSSCGPIKIGFSDDVGKRVAGLQTGNPELLTLLLVVPGTMETESSLHNRFASARIRQSGEWFRPTRQLLEFVNLRELEDKKRSRFSEAEFELKECMIAWSPVTRGRFLAPNDCPVGSVLVGRHPDYSDWSYNYLMTDGACWGYVQALGYEDAKHWIFNKAAHLIIRDGISPLAVHREFLKIEEYRDGLSDDMPGIGRPL